MAKMACVVALAMMFGCTDDAVDCGPMPEVPAWSASIFNGPDGKPAKVILPADQWFAHRQWIDDVRTWSACVSPTR